MTLLTLNSLNLFAQWQSDLRLTNDPAFSLTAFNNSYSVASNGNSVHVVWRDNRNVNYEILYKHSTDGGLTWSSDTRLEDNNDPATSRYPCVAVSGSVVHIVWGDERITNNEIYYKRSTDGGIAWGEDILLSYGSSFVANYPSLSVSGSNVHVVWLEDQILYNHSTDGGVTWATATSLTNTTSVFWSPSISSSGSKIHITWRDERDGNNEIYYKRSTDGGISWGIDTRLTNNSAFSFNPSLVASDSVVHVVWFDDRDGNYDIYYKRSTNSGLNWEADARLTNNAGNSETPTISVSGSIVNVVWRDDRDSNSEIYYKRSTDGGTSWAEDTRLTNNISSSEAPSVSGSGSSVHVVWHDNRDGNPEIYYKSDPTGNVTSIENLISELPEEFNLEQNYPNPFNPSTKIRYSIPSVTLSGVEWSRVQLKVYDVLGNEVATLINEEKPAGSYEVEFNASELSSGIYFYKLQAGSFIQIRKMILVK
jgi:hypothetical protein